MVLVCLRCKMVVHRTLKKLRYHGKEVQLGHVLVEEEDSIAGKTRAKSLVISVLSMKGFSGMAPKYVYNRLVNF